MGSAEVVGLMCLKVFVNGDQAEYERLKPYAEQVGAAFQKINFLRDMKADFAEMGRTYFPNVDMTTFNERRRHALKRRSVPISKKPTRASSSCRKPADSACTSRTSTTSGYSRKSVRFQPHHGRTHPHSQHAESHAGCKFLPPPQL